MVITKSPNRKEKKNQFGGYQDSKQKKKKKKKNLTLDCERPSGLQFIFLLRQKGELGGHPSVMPK